VFFRKSIRVLLRLIVYLSLALLCMLATGSTTGLLEIFSAPLLRFSFDHP